MPLDVASKELESHPLAQLRFETETRSWQIADETLQLTTLQNVEKSIDQVINWLESKGIEPQEIESLAPYFGVVWPSAIALSAYLTQSHIRRQFVGRSLLELGCGLGIPAIICSKAGARCTVVDNHPSVPSFLRRNVELNEPVALTFQSPEDALRNIKATSIRQYDWVIASDVLYDKNLVATFVEMISGFAAPEGRCVIADPGRAYIQDFVSAMNLAGWTDELVTWTVPGFSAQNPKSCDIFIVVFTRANVN